MDTVQNAGTLSTLEIRRESEIRNGSASQYDLDARSLLETLDSPDEDDDFDEDGEPILFPDYEYDEEGYLVSDGLPMAEYEIHRKNMTNVIEALEAHFALLGQTVYVSGNNYLHYRRGNRTKYVSPDCYVVFGAEQKIRANYKSWQEGGLVPSFVLEVTSKKTQLEDATNKYALYERAIQVQEYVRFDPYGHYLKPKLQGFTLKEGQYELMPLEPDGRLYSAELDLYLETQGDWLRLYDAKTGEYLRTPQEAERERRQERERANVAEAREEAERIRAEREATGRREERRRAEAEQRRAQVAEAEREAERRRAETAEARVAAEAKAREAAEAELARLRLELEAFRKSAEG